MTGRIEPLPLPSGPTVARRPPPPRRGLRGHPIAPYAATSLHRSFPGSPRVSPRRPRRGRRHLGLHRRPQARDAHRWRPRRLHQGHPPAPRRPRSVAAHPPAHHIAGLQVLLRGLVAGQEPIVTTTASVTDVVRGAAAMDPRRATLRLARPDAGGASPRDDGAGTHCAPSTPSSSAVRPCPDCAQRQTGRASSSSPPMACPRPAVVASTTVGHWRAPGSPSTMTAGCTWAARAWPAATSRTQNAPTPTSSPTRPGNAGSAPDDHGEFLPDSRLQVHGRLDDLITTGGLRVSPRLVEETIVAHCPGVIRALVVAVPDPEWGQAVGAIVTTASGTRLTREGRPRRPCAAYCGHALPSGSGRCQRSPPAVPASPTVAPPPICSAADNGACCVSARRPVSLALSIYCVIDCVRTDEHTVRGLPKLVWVFVVLLFPLAGSIAWLVAGRPSDPRASGHCSHAAPTTTPTSSASCENPQNHGHARTMGRRCAPEPSRCLRPGDRRHRCRRPRRTAGLRLRPPGPRCRAALQVGVNFRQ